MLCMTVNVVVGFLYILNVCLLSVFVISLVQGYVEKSVDHGMECCMFVLGRVI